MTGRFFEESVHELLFLCVLYKSRVDQLKLGELNEKSPPHVTPVIVVVQLSLSIPQGLIRGGGEGRGHPGVDPGGA